MHDFYGWGLYVGQVAGIRVRLHWMLLLWWVIQADDVLRIEGPYRKVALAGWALSVLICFLSIFLHELGHCFAARRVGGWADEILLWHLGGLAFCHCPDFWRSHLIVAAGGPLVTLAIWGVSLVAFTLIDPVASSAGGSMLLNVTEHTLVRWNGFILIFNLIPLYPMDGGRIFHALAWGWFSRRGGYAWGGRSLANRLTLQVSRVTACAGIIYGLTQESYFLIILFIWALSGAERLKEE